MNRIALTTAATIAAIALGSPAHADGPHAEPTPALTLCQGADTTQTYCVFDIPRAPDAPTFFIRKNATKVTISHDRAARKLTRWGYVLQGGFWRHP